VPALFVLGAASPIPARHGVASAGLIPGAQYQIEDCGHFPWLERPGSVRKALEHHPRVTAIPWPAAIAEPIVPGRLSLPLDQQGHINDDTVYRTLVSLRNREHRSD
jgi:hypothetical protein